MAFRISGYADRMKNVNRNTLALVEFFQRRKAVKVVNWSYQDRSRRNFEKIQRAPESPGGIITLELLVPLQSVYDPLRLAKGPSLGAEFTLVGPYLYHAHYSLVANEEGRRFLRASGLDPDLLRVSVGVESQDELIETFAEVL
jgi:cystathionine beta-lyase/cystathionine gamma-synthase